VYRHLVTVEVCVECGTYERVELYSASVNKHGLERLNGQTVECGCTVEEHGMFFDNVFKCIPYVRMNTLDLLLRVLDVGSLAHFYKSLDYEGLEELESHLARKSALIDLELRTYNDNRTAGIVDTLTEKVLTETTLLTAEHL
jgi:hypothetical protein